VPMADRMRRERSQGQNGRDGQQTFGNSFRHARPDVHVECILPLSYGNGQLLGSPATGGNGRQRMAVGRRGGTLGQWVVYSAKYSTPLTSTGAFSLLVRWMLNPERSYRTNARV
jgi:hypothetical protein